MAQDEKQGLERQLKAAKQHKFLYDQMKLNYDNLQEQFM